jgi:hypothetical protein
MAATYVPSHSRVIVAQGQGRYEGVLIVGGILGTADAPRGLLVDHRMGGRLVYRGVIEWGLRRTVVAAVAEHVRPIS